MNKLLSPSLWLAVSGTLLASCSTVTERIAPRAAQAITAYCLEPQATRLLVRQQVNELIKPNAVRIDCAGDAE